MKEDYILTKLDKNTAESEEVRMCFFLFIPPKIVHIVVMAIRVVVSPFSMAIFISHVNHWDTLVINSSERQKRKRLSNTLISMKTGASQSDKAVPLIHILCMTPCHYQSQLNMLQRQTNSA
jgi:hypothetical protein